MDYRTAPRHAQRLARQPFASPFKRSIGALNLPASQVAIERGAAVAAVQPIFPGAGLLWEEMVQDAASAQEALRGDVSGEWGAKAAALLRCRVHLCYGFYADSLLNASRLASRSPERARWLGRRAAGSRRKQGAPRRVSRVGGCAMEDSAPPYSAYTRAGRQFECESGKAPR